MIIRNETVNTILTRRSIRKFSQKPLSKDILETLAECGLYAPSAMGLQTWKFTVVTDPKRITELSDAVKQVLDRPEYDMYCPAALIIPSNDKESPYGKEDDACALENIFLAARSLGVGSVWINQLQNICDRPEIRRVLNALEIPENHVVYGLAALGYPEGALPEARPRKGGLHWVE